jgi:fructose-1,6-bisphosphatase/inositol monophosphatase family enzyme
MSEFMQKRNDLGSIPVHLLLATASVAVPAVKNRGDAVIHALMSSHPPLSSGESFEFRLVQGDVNITTGRDKFSTEKRHTDYLPVLSGGSINLWDDTYGEPFGWAGADMSSHLLEKATAGVTNKASAYYQQSVETIADLAMAKPRIVVRQIASATNTRTCIATLIPGERVVASGLHYLHKRQGTSGVRWVIDPLDGTVNFLYGLPVWAVSIGVEYKGAAVAGAVVVPVLGDAFVAWQGGGAWRHRDGKVAKIFASTVESLDNALIGTGFGYDSTVRTWQGTLAANVLPQVRDIRRAGAAAVDLCSVATGALDGYYETGLQPWDLCAGGLIASEAGAIVTGLHGATAGVRDVVAAGPRLHASLVGLLEKHDRR